MDLRQDLSRFGDAQLAEDLVDRVASDTGLDPRAVRNRIASLLSTNESTLDELCRKTSEEIWGATPPMGRRAARLRHAAELLRSGRPLPADEVSCRLVAEILEGAAVDLESGRRLSAGPDLLANRILER